MKPISALLALTLHLAMVSAISFGGFPTVLPDVHAFVVDTHGWLSDAEFTNIFAIAQATPGPNMILMMGLIGWHIGGLPGALAASTATFGPPCAIYFGAYTLLNRARDARWQDILKRALVPVTIGLIAASGFVMAQAAATGWVAVAVTAAAAAVMLTTRYNPLWLLAGGGLLGGFGFLA